MSTSIIVAIDPGWLNTGWCAVKIAKGMKKPEFLDAGVITNDKRKARSTSHAARTRKIFGELCHVLEMYKPAIVIYERNLGSRSVRAATAMRAAFTMTVSALESMGYGEDRVFEMTPQSIRKIITGKGSGVPKEELNAWIVKRRTFDIMPTVLLDQGVCRSRHEHALDAALIAYGSWSLPQVRRNVSAIALESLTVASAIEV